MLARVRMCVRESVVRFVKALEALEAVGRVSSVGRVRVLSVYERPVRRPSEMEPTNLSVDTVLEAMVSDQDYAPD